MDTDARGQIQSYQNKVYRRRESNCFLNPSASIRVNPRSSAMNLDSHKAKKSARPLRLRALSFPRLRYDPIPPARERRSSSTTARLLDDHFPALRHEIVQLFHVLVMHPHAALALAPRHALRHRRAV